MSPEKYIPLHILEKITNEFSAHSRIGTGGYGDVYKGVYNGREIAVKLLHVDALRGLDDQQFKNEVGNLLRVMHPNIIQLVGYCYETKKIYAEHNGGNDFSLRIYRAICFEYLQGGSLDKRLYDQSFAPNWSTRYNIIKGICEGLNFLHKCEPQILHLDLKPANILLDSSMEPKVADLGLSRLFTQSHTHVTERIIGTQRYMPPEFRKDQIISPKSDVFSLGVVMIEIMTGPTGYSNSFEMGDLAQLMQQVLSNWKNRIKATSEYPLEESHQVQTCIDTAMRCVEPDRNNRPTIAEILDILNKTETRIPKRQGIWFASATNHQVITQRSELELMLFDESTEAKPISLSFLEHITSGFSNDNEIGYGGFARVYKGILENGKVAVKKLSRTFDIDEKTYEEELLCLTKTKHKNIVRFLGYCSDTQRHIVDYEGNNVLADVRQRLLCFEYLPNGSLDKKITDPSRGLEWRKRYQIINGICDGLYYLHQKRIVHLDLKPANILLDDNMMPKIADFGLSRCFSETQSWTITSKLIGTLGYLAPEWYGCKKITFKLDIYSLGIIIIDILTGEKGYPDIENVLESWRNRLEKSQEETQLVQIRVCTQIAIECADFNPEKRPNIQYIIDKFRATKNAVDFATETGVGSSEVASFAP